MIKLFAIAVVTILTAVATLQSCSGTGGCGSSTTTTSVSTTTTIAGGTTTTTICPSTTTTSTATTTTTLPMATTNRTILLFGDSNLAIRSSGVAHSIPGAPQDGDIYIVDQFLGNGFRTGNWGTSSPSWAKDRLTFDTSRYHPDLIIIELGSMDSSDPNVYNNYASVISDAMVAANTTPVIWLDVPNINTNGVAPFQSAGVVAINAALYTAQGQHTNLWVISTDGITNGAFSGQCVYMHAVLHPLGECYVNLGVDPHYSEKGIAEWSIVYFVAANEAFNSSFSRDSAAVNAQLKLLIGLP